MRTFEVHYVHKDADREQRPSTMLIDAENSTQAEQMCIEQLIKAYGQNVGSNHSVLKAVLML